MNWKPDAHLTGQDRTRKASRRQGDLFTPPEPEFDGDTYDPKHDKVRLTGQLERVYALMSDGGWRTLSEVQKSVGGSEAACSARLRDLRKEKFGNHVVERRRRGRESKGLYEYKLVDTP